MGQATVGIIGAVLGAATVFLSSYLAFRYQLRVGEKNFRYQLRLEEEKSQIARDDALGKELRSYIAEVEREMFSALHSMDWITWYGRKERKVDRVLINDELISQYHKEIHMTAPKLLGHLAAVVSINKQVYQKLSDRWHELQKVDDKIANALVDYNKSREESLKTLEECHSTLMGLYKSLPEALADSIKSLQS